MAATLVKAPVLVLMGALLVLGERRQVLFHQPGKVPARRVPMTCSSECRSSLEDAGAELLQAWPMEPTLNLGAGTWSGNMKALLHRYIENDDHFNEVASWSLMVDGTGFNKSAWGDATVANQQIEDTYSGSLESLKNLWYARQKYLKVAAEQMTRWVNTVTTLDVQIFPTGSTKLTSDQDVQIAMNLCSGRQAAAWTTARIRVLADVVLWIRHFSSSLIALPGSADASIVLEELYDINFYPPTLFNKLPDSCKERFRREFYYEGPGDTIAFHVFLGARLANPRLIRRAQKNRYESDVLAFLKTEGFRATRNFDVTNTPLFLGRWKSRTAPKLEKLLLCAQVSSPCSRQVQRGRESRQVQRGREREYQRKKRKSRCTRCIWNSMMLDMTQSNTIGPEMYLTISSILYVAYNMQMGQAIDQEVLPKFGIVTAFENLVHYKHTGKDKYRERVCDPYNRYLSLNSKRGRHKHWKHWKHHSYFKETFEHIESVIKADPAAGYRAPGEAIFDPVALAIVKDGFDAMVSDIEEFCSIPLI